MRKVAVSIAAALLALGVLSAPRAAHAQPYDYPPRHVAWVVAEGFSGESGIPWPGPPWAVPFLPPKLGCYTFRQRLKGAWRQVEVCE
jgi:hypothetical protein